MERKTGVRALGCDEVRYNEQQHNERLHNEQQHNELRYSILDPTGNITALVESPVAVEWQPSVALKIMKRHPQVEQVGFVSFDCGSNAAADAAVELRMAGGEFCGNATMSTAALYLLRRDGAGEGTSSGMPVHAGELGDESSQVDGLNYSSETDSPLCEGAAGTEPVSASERNGVPSHGDACEHVDDAWETVLVRVSGAANLVEVKLHREGPDAFAARIHMPAALRIDLCDLAFQQVHELLPVVVMEGISHIVIQSDSAFFGLRDKLFDAELAVCTWCEELKADGLGLMFLEGEGATRRMTPLVYVPGSGTVFWENSCASGSSAVGRYVAAAAGEADSLALNEPGGVLRVDSDPTSGEIWLQGTVRLVESLTMEDSQV